jgi:hypothetical protein
MVIPLPLLGSLFCPKCRAHTLFVQNFVQTAKRKPAGPSQPSMPASIQKDLLSYHLDHGDTGPPQTTYEELQSCTWVQQSNW